MIVIIEGPDGGGKSTLARHLATRYNLSYHHEGPPPPGISVLDHYGQLLQAARGKGVVFDRLALGERVYGPIVRNDDRLGLDDWRVFHRLITAAGARQILCLPRYEVCATNWSSGRPEYVSQVSLFEKIYARYQSLWEPDMLVYDYQRDSLDGFTAQLDQELASLPANMVGDPRATYLLVGERGSNTATDLDLPFFGNTHSSGYLNRALQLTTFEEHELAFINAFSLAHTITQVPTSFSHVIALGRQAHLVCAAQDVLHDTVPHPQFWSRFHHKDVDGYVSLLNQCRL